MVAKLCIYANICQSSKVITQYNIDMALDNRTEFANYEAPFNMHERNLSQIQEETSIDLAKVRALTLFKVHF